MEFKEKLKLMRKAEGLSQAGFCELMDMSISTVKKIETGIFEPGWSIVVKITQHPQFKKYALWLTTDETAEESGQISPVLSPDGQGDTSSHPNGQKVG